MSHSAGETSKLSRWGSQQLFRIKILIGIKVAKLMVPYDFVN